MSERTAPAPGSAVGDRSRPGPSRLPEADRRLDVLAAIQAGFVDGRDPQHSLHELLEAMLDATGSPLGFVLEVDQRPDGAPLVLVRSVAGRGGDALVGAPEAGLALSAVGGLPAAVMTSRETLLVNDTARDARGAASLPGLPPLRSFLGMPVLKGTAVIGVAGVANRAEGYGEGDMAALRPMLSLAAGIIDAWRERRGRAAAEARLRDFGDIATDWLWESDAEHRFSFVSERGARSGLDAAAMIGLRRWDLAAEFDPSSPTWHAHMADLSAHRPFRDFTYRLRTDDGRPLYLSIDGRPFFDGAGRFCGFRGTARDVTAAMVAQDELAQHRAILQELVDHLSFGVTLVDRNLRALAFNRAFLDLLGFPRDRFKFGDSFEKFIRYNAERGEYGPGPIDRIVAERVARARSIEPHAFERTRPNGRVIAVRGVPLSGGGFVTTYMDVTDERRRVQEIEEGRARIERQARELVRQREALQALLDSIPFGVALFDADLRIQAFNRSLLEMFELPPEVMQVGKSFEETARFLAARGEYGPGSVEDLVAERRKLFDTRVRQTSERRRPNGRMLSLANVPLPDGGFVTIYVDVTEDRRQVEEIEESRQRIQVQAEELIALAQKLDEARRQAEAARDSAEAASAAKSRFLATVSHEIRTPLNGVVGMIGLLSDTSLTPEQARLARTARESAEALLVIINDLLDFAKLEGRKLELEVAPFDLTALVDSVLMTFGQRALAQGIALGSYIDPLLPERLSGDVGRIRQILVNLVGNAVKFTERGGVIVEAERDGRGGVLLRVIDTGIGIPADTQAALFQPFTQADATISRRFGGTGLGLSICKELCTLMGGAVGVASEPGKGSTFEVWLPLEAAPSAEPRAGDALVLANLKALIVAESELQRRLVSRQLAGWRLRVTPVASLREGLDAVAAAAQEPFDVALVDVSAAGSAGRTATGALRKAAGAGGLKIIALVANAAAALRQDIGADECLVKPVGQRDLASALRSVMLGRGGAMSPAGRRQRSAERTLAVLAAEDNPVNQILIRALLERRGHAVEVVGNGAEAVDAMRRRPFDVVLMDVQMPVMDGIEATRQIRLLDGAERPVIVALTAHVLPGDRERFLESGFDAYLSKPIERASLDAVLEPLERRRPEAAVAAAMPAPVEPLIDPALLGRLKADLPGKQFSEVCGIFIGHGEKLLVDLRRATSRGDSQSVARLLHDLKGMVAGYGLRRLARLLAETEKSCQSSGARAVEPRLAEIEAVARDSFALVRDDLDRVGDARPQHGQSEG
ncbi:MAG: PAS-domain containing protein [Alphaproteobacteria bacterium]|nr:PAS-domain containing protein [Alphaproteobacteria bacterium]